MTQTIKGNTHTHTLMFFFCFFFMFDKIIQCKKKHFKKQNQCVCVCVRLHQTAPDELESAATEATKELVHEKAEQLNAKKEG